MSQTLLKNVKSRALKEPVVVVPALLWEQMRKQLDEYKEYKEMSTSKKYVTAIARARKAKKEVALETLIKKFAIS